MIDTLDLLLLISVINLTFLVLSSRRPQSSDRVTIGDIWDSVSPHAWILALAFTEVLGGWFLFPAVMGKLSEIQATHPELSSGPNSWIITALPWVFAAILGLMPVVFIMSKLEERKQ